MISIENLTVEFGVKPLFKNVSFIINDNDFKVFEEKCGTRYRGRSGCGNGFLCAAR